jgi:hypothetical protein
MTACCCADCSPDPAATYSEKHRRECEQRMVAAMSPRRRVTYINGVRNKRGLGAAEALERAQGGLF